MGFVKDVARVATFGAAGQLFGGGKKKKDLVPPRIPTMISTVTPEPPRSMIGAPRGGY